ncbi:CidA/LrgA family protein [Gracilibacillus alcaliphilus]|uniref:CidA/LrgA family protein n=1 Tax=Gracilibacillus alcaliphilus TaxID=1401441 RepID=UPI00195B97BC|nr:CidA/LrgA family holin-like protein [Gracilibacillus alcaliphilus]MBM7678477.1 holin-like protein [Gracilibacillus alcaliphilus]
MKYIMMLLQISVLFLFYYIGMFIQNYFSLVIPGSLIGMLLLFSLLVLKVIKLSWIRDGIDILLKDMPLFFIPVTVGVVQYLDFFYGKGSIVLIIVVVSTLLVIALSSWITDLMLRKEEQADD